MRGLHPELCGWLSAAASTLDALEQGSARAVSAAARGADGGPELREALAAAAWVSQRLRLELQDRIVALFGAVTVEAVEPVDGLPALVRTAVALEGAWRDALPRVDAHTRLLLRLQLAQWQAVVVPALTAACGTPGDGRALRLALADRLPPPPDHPEAFLGLLGPPKP